MLVCVVSNILFLSSARTLAWYSGVNSPTQTGEGERETGREEKGEEEEKRKGHSIKR